MEMKADQQIGMKVTADVKELYDQIDQILDEGNKDLTKSEKMKIILTAAEKNLTKASASKFISSEEIKTVDYHVKRIGEVYMEVLKRTEDNEKKRQEEIEEIKAELQAKVEKTEAKFQSMKEEIQYRTEERDGLAKLNDELSEENRNVKNALHDKEKIISNIEIDLEEKKQQLINLKITEATTQKEKKEALTQNVIILEENNSLKNQSQEMLLKIKNLETELNFKNLELQRAEKDINIKDSQIQTKDITIEELRKEHKEIIKAKDITIDELNKNLIERQIEIQKILSEKDKEISELNRKFFELQQEMQNKIIKLMENSNKKESEKNV